MGSPTESLRSSKVGKMVMPAAETVDGRLSHSRKKGGSKPRESISCVMLAYAEEDNLKILLPEIRGILDRTDRDYEILIVDAAEPLDASEAVCDEYGAIYVNQEEPYFGGALKTAISHASKDLFLILDADGSCSPKDITRLLDAFDKSGSDIVMGSRYVEGGYSDGTAASKAMSKVLNAAFRRALRLPVRDMSLDFRVYRTKDLQQLELQCDNYDILEEVLLKLKLHKERGEGGGSFTITEIPVSFEKRVYGKTHRQLIKFIMNYLKTLVRLWALRIMAERSNQSFPLLEKRAETVANGVLYIVIGCFGALIDYAAFSAFILVSGLPSPDTIFQFMGIAELANIVGAFFGSLVCFHLNSFYNFMAKDHLLIRYGCYVCVVLIGTCLSTLLMTLLRNALNIYVVKAICVVVAAILQFFINKNVTFRKKKVSNDEPATNL